MFFVPCCNARYDFRINTMFGSSLPPVVCWRVHVLFTLLVYSCFCFVFLRLVYHILPVSLGFSSSCVPYLASFSGFFFVLCTISCQFLWVFLRLVYHILPVSLGYPFWIATSVFSNVYLELISKSVTHSNFNTLFLWCKNIEYNFTMLLFYVSSMQLVYVCITLVEFILKST